MKESSLGFWILGSSLGSSFLFFRYADDTYVFIKTTITERMHDYYWQKQRYSTNTQIVVGYNFQFIDITTGFFGSIDDSRVVRHTALYQKANSSEILLESKVIENRHQLGTMLLEYGINSLSKLLLKPYIFSPTLSTQEKNFKNLSSARITVERVLLILKVRWRGLLLIERIFQIRLIHVLFYTIFELRTVFGRRHFIWN